MVLSPTQGVLLVTLVVCGVFYWYIHGQGRWRRHLETRFYRGVPWGTLVVLAVVVGFYLFAQSGLRDWSSPVTLPYVTWSYLYPTGLLTAGIAHGSSAHLLSNLTATLVFAPIAEYVWGHFPPERREAGPPMGAEDADTGRFAESAWEWGDIEPPAQPDETGAIADGGRDPGLLERPWVRALVAFPAALLGLAFVTAFFSMGPTLGFSGAVYALLGFAVVVAPKAAIVGVVATSALGVLLGAMANPVVRAGIESGAPSPPGWAGIGFQAHALGFLVGVLLAIALVHHRRETPAASWVFAATFLVGLVQSLWLLVGASADGYVLYQGVGVTLVAALTVLVTVAATGSSRPLVARLSGTSWLPTPRQIAAFWLAVVGIVFLGGLVGVVLAGELVALVALVPMTLLFAAPALIPLVREVWAPPHMSRRAVAVTCLLVVTVLVALPSLPLGMIVVDDAPTDTGEVVVEGYTVTYEQAATSGQQPAIDLGADDLYASEQSGVIVVDPDRQLWTVGVPDYRLEHAGEATVQLGALGWQESVTADRTGWDVVGNESAYVVDLTVDGETTRSFTSDPVRADAVVDGHAIELVPTEDAFEVRTLRDGGEVASVPIPDAGTSVIVGDLTVTSDTVDDSERLSIAGEGTVVTVAERETYE